MPPPAPPSAAASTLDDALAWLAREPGSDPLSDLAPLRSHLQALAASALPPSHKLRIIEVFEPRIRRAGLSVAPWLLDAALPLPQPVRDITRAMIQIHGLGAGILLAAASAGEANPPGKPRRAVARICEAALNQIEQQLLLALMAFGRSPLGLWSDIQFAYQLSSSLDDAGCRRVFGQILALAAAQPESFTSRELAFLREVLARLPETAVISSKQPQDVSIFFWLDAAQDISPVASPRLPPPVDSQLLFVSFAPLLGSFESLLEQLASGTPATRLGLPREANLPDYLNILRRAQALWSNPPTRHFPRRRQSHEVELCVRLGELWHALRDESAGEISKWMLINKSPDGCAVEHVAGNIGGLIAGSALGLRETAGGPWSICLVRWVRGSPAERVEIGLEFVAPHAQAIHLVAGATEAESIPGLLLPALPQLSRREALLTARGRHGRHRFNLVAEKEGRIMLTTCQPGDLIQQTSSVEIFEFERIRTPD